MHLLISYGAWGKIEASVGAVIGAFIGVMLYRAFLFDLIIKVLCPK